MSDYRIERDSMGEVHVPAALVKVFDAESGRALSFGA